MEKAGAGLSDEDRRAMYTALESISSNLRTISKEGIGQHEVV